jgi:transcription antitermination factor NusG
MHPNKTQLNFASEAMQPGWYAVYTRHQHEKSAARLLAGKGYDVLLPLYQSLRQWKDRSQTVFLPLFPNYLFVEADLERKVEVLRTAGVCWLVCSGGTPARIPPEQIENLQRLRGGSVDLQPHSFLKCGDRVRVRTGPLAGLEGMLVREKNQHRVVVSMELLQKSASVEVDLSILEPVTSSHAAPPSAIRLMESRCMA